MLAVALIMFSECCNETLELMSIKSNDFYVEFNEEIEKTKTKINYEKKARGNKPLTSIECSFHAQWIFGIFFFFFTKLVRLIEINVSISTRHCCVLTIKFYITDASSTAFVGGFRIFWWIIFHFKTHCEIDLQIAMVENPTNFCCFSEITCAAMTLTRIRLYNCIRIFPLAFVEIGFHAIHFHCNQHIFHFIECVRLGLSASIYLFVTCCWTIAIAIMFHKIWPLDKTHNCIEPFPLY